MLQRIFSHHHYKLIYLFLIELFFVTNTTAQTDSTSLFFKNYSIADGLSNNHVNCFFKDSQGFMWIGTDNGLNRFDGTNFKIFTNDFNDSLSLPNNIVIRISMDGDSNLWISTWTNLCKYNYKTQTFKTYLLQVQNDSLSKPIAKAYCLLDSKKNFWAVTYNTGLFLYDNTRDCFIQYPLPANIIAQPMEAIAGDNHHNLWIPCLKDLLIFDTRYKTFEYHQIALTEKGIERHVQFTNTIYFDPSDTTRIWAGSFF